VWVQEDDDVDAAKTALAVFLENPDDPRFRKLQKKAEEQRKEIAAEEKKSRHKVMRAREAFKKPAIGWLTALLIGGSVILTIATQFGETPFTNHLWFAQGLATATGGFDPILSLRYTYLQEHEWWRLFTPMFLHLGLLHLLFNMWWLKDLGTAIEHVQSTGKLLLMIVVFELTTAFGQFLVEAFFFGAYSRFGGFSGVVYGLFGYLWMRGKYDPTFPVRLSRSTVLWMMAWFILCFTDFIPIANTAHAVGLIVGATWGFLESGYIGRKWLRS
jgi:GlpG protein